MKKTSLVGVLLVSVLVSGCLQHTGGGGSVDLAATARKYEGTNPTGYSSLWCADFINLVLRESGDGGTSSRAARSFLGWGQWAPSNCVNCIAVLARGRNKGHVGVVVGRDAQGNPILVSGNHNNTVAEAPYPKGRVLGYRYPKMSNAYIQQSSLQ